MQSSNKDLKAMYRIFSKVNSSFNSFICFSVIYFEHILSAAYLLSKIPLQYQQTPFRSQQFQSDDRKRAALVEKITNLYYLCQLFEKLEIYLPVFNVYKARLRR